MSQDNLDDVEQLTKQLEEEIARTQDQLNNDRENLRNKIKMKLIQKQHQRMGSASRTYKMEKLKSLAEKKMAEEREQAEKLKSKQKEKNKKAKARAKKRKQIKKKEGTNLDDICQEFLDNST